MYSPAWFAAGAPSEAALVAASPPVAVWLANESPAACQRCNAAAPEQQHVTTSPDDWMCQEMPTKAALSSFLLSKEHSPASGTGKATFLEAALTTSPSGAFWLAGESPVHSDFFRRTH